MLRNAPLTPSSVRVAGGQPSMERSDLKRKTFHSVLWTIARIGSTNVLTFVVFSVLARTLSPAQFGIFALASVCIEFSKTLSTGGLQEVVFQNRELDEELAASIFWASLALSVLVGGVFWGF